MIMWCDNCKKEQLPENPADKHCTDCGHELESHTTPPIAAEPETPKEPEIPKEPEQSTSHGQPATQNSKVWYLLPIFFSIIGGIVMYAALRGQNNDMAKKGLIVGAILVIPGIVLIGFSPPMDCEDIQREIDHLQETINLDTAIEDEQGVRFLNDNLNMYQTLYDENCT